MDRGSRFAVNALATVFLMVGTVAVGLGGSSVAGASSSGRKTAEIAVFSPFSGINAEYGAYEYSGCPPAVNLINADGGVNGYNLTCTIVDNRGEPADAVPAARQMLALSSHLVGIIDANSGFLSSVVPIFSQAKVTDMSMGGDIEFDKSTYPYFWRTIPGDDVEGYAMAAWAKKQGWTRVAAIFSSDSAAQGNVPGLVAGAKRFGIKIVINESITPDQTSYATEITNLMASHPQAIMTEMDPQSAGTFYGQLKQAGGLKTQIVGSSGTLGISWDTAAISGMGKADFKKYFKILTNYAPASGTAWTVWDKSLLASKKQLPKPAQWATQIYSEIPYDNVTLMALAMLDAHSMKPSVYNRYIAIVAAGGPGAVVVHDFAQGKTALAAGKKIQYVGVSGVIRFDKYHNSPGAFAAEIPGNNNAIYGVLTPAEVAASEGL
jgi:branched-chain amino acid transport system substrate-binding protein